MKLNLVSCLFIDMGKVICHYFCHIVCWWYFLIYIYMDKTIVLYYTDSSCFMFY